MVSMERHSIQWWIRHGVSVLNMPLVALLSWELADWTWMGVMRFESTTENISTQSPQGTQFADHEGRGGRQPGWNEWFGTSANPEKNIEKKTVTNAPATLLDAKLLGILSATHNSVVTRALIAGKNIPESTYGIGDSVGPAVIRDIEWDRVVLDNQGKLETLRLPRGGGEGNHPSQSMDARSNVSEKTQTLISQLWNQFESKPESILENIRIEPVFQNGQFKGVRLLPGKDAQFLEQFGVQAGDTVTWVNGVELTDPMKGMEILSKLGTAESMQFRVLRGSESHAFEFHRQ